MFRMSESSNETYHQRTIVSFGKKINHLKDILELKSFLEAKTHY